MSNKLDEEVKARVEPETKEAFKALAEERHLKVPDLMREAFRDYLDKHSKKRLPKRTT